MKKNIWICAFATICAGAILTGCGKEKPAPQESQLPEQTEAVQVIETETQEPATETHEGEARSPFTGEWIDETVATKRPVAVMTEKTFCLPFVRTGSTAPYTVYPPKKWRR